MGWFGKRRQEERDNMKTKELHDMEEAIAVISARLKFLGGPYIASRRGTASKEARQFIRTSSGSRRWTESPSTTDTRTPWQRAGISQRTKQRYANSN